MATPREEGDVFDSEKERELYASLYPLDGVAVDSSGNIFVGKLGPAIPGTNTLYYGEMTKYNSAGSSLGQFAILPSPIMRMTIDSINNLYATSDSFDERLIKVTSSGSVSTLK